MYIIVGPENFTRLALIFHIRLCCMVSQRNGFFVGLKKIFKYFCILINYAEQHSRTMEQLNYFSLLENAVIDIKILILIFRFLYVFVNGKLLKAQLRRISGVFSLNFKKHVKSLTYKLIGCQFQT